MNSHVHGFHVLKPVSGLMRSEFDLPKPAAQWYLKFLGINEDTLIHRCGDSMVALANSNFPFNCFFESETSTSVLILAQASVVLNEDIHDVDATRSDSPNQSMTVVKDSDPSTDLSTRVQLAKPLSL
jgi:hypothetical protein